MVGSAMLSTGILEYMAPMLMVGFAAVVIGIGVWEVGSR